MFKTFNQTDHVTLSLNPIVTMQTLGEQVFRLHIYVTMRQQEGKQWNTDSIPVDKSVLLKFKYNRLFWPAFDFKLTSDALNYQAVYEEGCYMYNL